MAMQLTRREMLELAGALAAGGVLAGCSPAPDATEIPTTPTPTPVQGRVGVMTMRNELTEEEQARFEQSHPGITIDFYPQDEGRLSTMAAAGTPPDLFRVEVPHVPRTLARGLLRDLSAYFAASPVLNEDDLAPACAAYRANGPFEVGSGPIYGLPKDWSPDHTLFVNVEILDTAGIEIPGDETVLTYWDVAELARRLARFEDGRAIRWGYVYSDFWQEGVWENMLLEMDKSLYVDGFSRFNGDDDVKNVMRYYHDLAAAKLIPSPLNPGSVWSGSDFLSGRAAVGQFGYWFAPFVFGTPVEGKIKMLAGPMWAGERRNPTISGAGTVMAATTGQPDAAWKVFEWYHGLEPAVTRAQNGLGIPSLVSLYGLLPQGTGYQQQAARVALAEAALETPPIQFHPYVGGTPIAEAYTENLASVLEEEITFDQFFATVEARVNRTLIERWHGG